MAKKKRSRKKASKAPKWAVGPGVGAAVAHPELLRKRRTKRRRRPVLGSLGRKDSGTVKSHKPLKVLKIRLQRLNKIVAARSKNPKKWA